jgi:hypothetical protein
MNDLGMSLGQAECFLNLLAEDEVVASQTFSDRDETKVKNTTSGRRMYWPVVECADKKVNQAIVAAVLEAWGGG